MNTTTALQTHEACVQLAFRLCRHDFELNVDLSLPSSGVTVLFGPSGSGKTSLLRCVAGLERAQGTVRIGQSTWQSDDTRTFLPTWQRNLGYVFQEASLFEHLNVHANLIYGVKRVTPALKTSAAQALEHAIELLGIGHLLNRQPAGLSGGERQRVAIARALATQPQVLLLDEPLAALDTVRKQEVLPWLERLHQKLRIPVLYVTHSMQELTRLADYVVLMGNGHARLHGPAGQVLANAQFASSVGSDAGALLGGVVTGHDERFHLNRVTVGEHTLWIRDHDLANGTPVRLHVHANDISIALSEPKDSSIQNRLPGAVLAMASDTHPAHALVTVQCGGQHVLCRVTKRALHELELQPGKAVWVQIKSVALAGH